MQIFATLIHYSAIRIPGVKFGPYGGDFNSEFVWDAGEKAPVKLAGRLGLLYFSGRAWGIPPNLII